MFSIRKKITNLFIYEIALLTLAFGVAIFDLVYISHNPKPIAHRQQQAGMSHVAVDSAAFSKSCEGLDMNSTDLKTVVQRGFCSTSKLK